MTLNVDNHMTDTAVVWTNAQPDGYGKFTYDGPIEISCRWVKKRTLYRADNGEEKISDTVVYTTTELSLGDRIYKGDKSDLDSSSNAYLEGVREVRQIEQQRDTDGNTIMWKVVT